MIKTIIIKDKWVLKDGFSPNEYLAYFGFNIGLRRNVFSYYYNSVHLGYLLTKKYPINTKLRSSITVGVLGLAEIDFISIVDSHVKEEWILDLKVMIDDNLDKNDYYTAIDETDIQEILLSNGNYYTKVISIVKFYSYLMSTLHKKDEDLKGIGFKTIEEMKNDTGYTRKTISSYIKNLEELKLIYVYRSNDFILFKDGGIVEISNTYGRYCDKDKIINIGKQHENDYGSNINAQHKILNKSNMNKSRSYSQKLNIIATNIESGKDIPYKYDECKDIYITLLELNEKYKKDRPNRIKDLSVFQDFDFYKK